MSKRFYTVTIELDLNSISCPGVWLCPSGKAFVKICIFGVSELTKEVDPFFPLVFNERFSFLKVFKEVDSVYELQEKIGSSVITLELMQCPVGSVDCIKLALFNARLSDLLHPYVTCFSKPSDSSGIELLFIKCKRFPGIIAPKADVSAKVEVIDSFGEPTARGDTKGRVESRLKSKSAKDEERRRQQPVCHTKNNLNCKCFHDPEDIAPQKRQTRQRDVERRLTPARPDKPLDTEGEFGSTNTRRRTEKPDKDKRTEQDVWPDRPWAPKPSAAPNTHRKKSTSRKRRSDVRRVESKNIDDIYQEEMRRAMEDCDRLLKEYNSAGSIFDEELRNRYDECLKLREKAKKSDTPTRGIEAQGRSRSSSTESFNCTYLPSASRNPSKKHLVVNQLLDSDSSSSFDETKAYASQPPNTLPTSGNKMKNWKNKDAYNQQLYASEVGHEPEYGSAQNDIRKSSEEEIEQARFSIKSNDVCSCVRIKDEPGKNWQSERVSKWDEEVPNDEDDGRDGATRTQGRAVGGSRVPQQNDELDTEACECRRCLEYERKYKPRVHPCPQFRKQRRQSEDRTGQGSVARAEQRNDTNKEPRSSQYDRPSPSPPWPTMTRPEMAREPETIPRARPSSFGETQRHREDSSPARRPPKSRERGSDQGDAPDDEPCDCPQCEEYQRRYNPLTHPCPRFKKGSKSRQLSPSWPKKLISSRKNFDHPGGKKNGCTTSCREPPDKDVLARNDLLKYYRKE